MTLRNTPSPKYVAPVMFDRGEPGGNDRSHLVILHPRETAVIRTVVIRRLRLAVLLAWGAVAPALIAQNPTLPPPGQAQSALQQALLQNPGLADSIRARLLGSGLTADQIRARLEASGYPTNLLDAYLGSRASGRTSATPVATELTAIEALGLPPIRLPGDSLRADTGMVPLRRAGPSRPGRLVFWVAALRGPTTQILPLLSAPAPPHVP